MYCSNSKPNKYQRFSQAYRSDRACDAVQQIVHSHLLGIHLLYHVVLRRIQLVQQHLAGVDLDGEFPLPHLGSPNPGTRYPVGIPKIAGEWMLI